MLQDAQRLSSPARQKQAKRRFKRVRVERNVRHCLIGITDQVRKESDDRRDDDPAASDTSVRSLELAGR